MRWITILAIDRIEIAIDSIEIVNFVKYQQWYIFPVVQHFFKGTPMGMTYGFELGPRLGYQSPYW